MRFPKHFTVRSVMPTFWVECFSQKALLFKFEFYVDREIHTINNERLFNGNVLHSYMPLKYNGHIQIKGFTAMLLEPVYPKQVDFYNNLFETKILADYKFIVGETEFFAHKCILANRSTFFYDIFRENVDQNQMTITNVDPDAFVEILAYIYMGKKPNFNQHATDILTLAEQYQLTELKASCEKVMVEMLNKKTLLLFYKTAETYQLRLLKYCCDKLTKEMFPELQIDTVTSAILEKLLCAKRQLRDTVEGADELHAALVQHAKKKFLDEMVKFSSS